MRAVQLPLAVANGRVAVRGAGLPEQRPVACKIAAQPGAGSIFAVEVGGVDFDAREGTEGGEPIDAADHRLLIDAAGRRVPRPTDDEGNPHAPFVLVVLAAAEWTGIPHGVEADIAG